MSKVQTRRAISFNAAVYKALQDAALKAGFNCAEYATRILREHLPDLPFTDHEPQPLKCECGNSKPRKAEACNRCSYLDGGKQMRTGEIVSALRGSDGLSMRELCEALAIDDRTDGGQRQMWRWLKVLLEQGRIRRYWSENTSPVTTRLRARGTDTERHNGMGCWLYALDGKTEREWERAA